MISCIHNIFKFKTWAGICLTSICVVILSIKVCTVLIILRPSINELIELQKCPVCYGVSECDEIQKTDVTPADVLSWVSYLFGIKNVFFGTLKGTKIVIKKLAHTSELKAFDQVFNDLENTKQSINFYDLVKKEISLNFTKDNESRLRLCPTTEHIDKLFYNIHHKTKSVYTEYAELHLWTLIKINPEPLVLQVLPAEDGWPVPKYIGACGRIIAEEYVGLPLSAYYHKPWIFRARIALSLLDAAYMFTFQNKDFAFYLTDISADNIAIDSDGVAKFIDLENIIIVDKNVSGEKSKEWFALQENTADFDCIDCLVFSAADICSHHTSDHNYYSVCKVRSEISLCGVNNVMKYFQLLLVPNAGDSSLPGGLLHDVPLDISENYPSLQELIRQCVKPVPPQTRITVADKISQLIRTIL